MSTLRARAERVERFVDARARTLQASYGRNTSAAVAELARLRRGVGIPLGANLELIGLALSNPWGDADDQRDLFEGALPTQDDPTPEEQAAYAAITLFALHQQSKRGASMHRSGYSFGRSARLLGKRVDRDSIRARFTALGTATTWDEALHHARGLIQQFRQYDIPLDYGRFARDLFDLRTGRGDRVRTSWGRDYYRLKHPDDDTPTDSDAERVD